MADPFAPLPRRLDERFDFGRNDRVRDEMRALVTAIEDRLTALEAFVPDWALAVDHITEAQNERLASSIETMVTQITAWAEEAQIASEEAVAAAAQAGQLDATAYVKRNGTQSFNAVSAGVAPAAASRSNALVTGAWVGTELDVAIAGVTAAFQAADAASASAAVTLLRGSVSPLHDTLKKLSDSIGNSASFALDQATALANRVRYDADQTLTQDQRSQALKNLAKDIITANGPFSILAVDGGRMFLLNPPWYTPFTVGHTITAAAAKAGFRYYVKNISAEVATIDPNGVETIDGAATLACLPGQEFWVVCDGTNWQTVGRQNIVVLARTAIAAPTASVFFTVPRGWPSLDLRVNAWGHNNGGGAGVTAASLALRFARDQAKNVIASGNYFYDSFYTEGASPGTISTFESLSTTNALLSMAATGLWGNNTRALICPDLMSGIAQSSTSVSVGGGNQRNTTISFHANAGVPATGIEIFPAAGLFTRGTFELIGIA